MDKRAKDGKYDGIPKFEGIGYEHQGDVHAAGTKPFGYEEVEKTDGQPFHFGGPSGHDIGNDEV